MKSISEKINEFFLINQSGRFVALEGLRAFAILSVFNVHFFPWVAATKAIQDPINFNGFINSILVGHFGVDLFFCLSGFLIYRTIIKNQPTMVGFILNRYRRLLPAHLVVLFNQMTVNALIPNLLNILFLDKFISGTPSLNFVTWSLDYEMFFYLICALWLIFGYRYSFARSWFFYLFLFCLLYSSNFLIPIEYYNGQKNFVLPEARFIGFFCGIGVAKIYESAIFKKIEKFLSYSSLTIFISILIGIFMFSRVKPNQYNYFYLYMNISFSLLILSLISSKDHLLKSFFSFKPFRILGAISYSFYLSHAMWGVSIGARIIEQYTFLQHSITAYFVALIVTIIISVFMFHFLEKPYFKRD